MNGTFRGGLWSLFFGSILLTTPVVGPVTDGARAGALVMDCTVALTPFTVLQESLSWFRTESMA
jgi:uncharacterized membrane protein